MSKKKSKKRQAIDKAFEEMGITPVPPDHPIYKMGPTIRFISRLPVKIQSLFMKVKLILILFIHFLKVIQIK